MRNTRALLRSFCRLLVSDRLFGDEIVAMVLGSDLQLTRNSSEERIAAFRHLLATWRDAVNADEPPALSSDAALLDSAGPPPSDMQVALLMADVLNLPLSEIEAILAPQSTSVTELVISGRLQLAGSAEGDVVVLEDEFLIAEDLRGIIESLSASVKGMASNVAKGLDLVRTHAPQVILVDYRLRGGPTGLDFVRQVREFHDCTSIFVTAFPDLLLQGDEDEPDAVITKPYTREGVRAAVAHALSTPRIPSHPE